MNAGLDAQAQYVRERIVFQGYKAWTDKHEAAIERSQKITQPRTGVSLGARCPS